MWRSTIFDLAKQRGWSQEELARQLGVQGSTLSRMRRGLQGPGRKLMLSSAALFGQSVNTLFWYEPDAKPEPPVQGAA